MADPQQLERLRQGIGAWNAWRNAHPGTHPDLRAADLRAANLTRATFTNTNMTSAIVYETIFANLDLRTVIPY